MSPEFYLIFHAALFVILGACVLKFTDYDSGPPCGVAAFIAWVVLLTCTWGWVHVP